MEKTEQMTDDQKVEFQIALRDQAGALSVVEQSAALVVTDDATKAQSIEIENQAKKEKQRDLAFLKPFVEAKKAAHTKAVATRDTRLGKYDKVITDEGSKRATWGEKERIRLAKEAEERAAQEAAERAERVANAKKAIDEAIGTSEDTQETIDLLNLMLEEDEMTDEQAEVIRARIATEQAVLDGATRAAAEEAAKTQMELNTLPSPPPMAPAKVKGEVTGYKYTVTVTDMQALCKAIGEGKVAIAAVKEAQGKLNSYAKDGLINDGQYGCDVFREPTSHTRGG